MLGSHKYDVSPYKNEPWFWIPLIESRLVMYGFLLNKYSKVLTQNNEECVFGTVFLLFVFLLNLLRCSKLNHYIFCIILHLCNTIFFHMQHRWFYCKLKKYFMQQTYCLYRLSHPQCKNQTSLSYSHQFLTNKTVSRMRMSLPLISISN